MQGGPFTITNIGSRGGRSFTPFINDPQVAILGMARASWQPVVRRAAAPQSVALIASAVPDRAWAL